MTDGPSRRTLLAAIGSTSAAAALSGCTGSVRNAIGSGGGECRVRVENLGSGAALSGGSSSSSAASSASSSSATPTPSATPTSQSSKSDFFQSVTVNEQNGRAVLKITLKKGVIESKHIGDVLVVGTVTIPVVRGTRTYEQDLGALPTNGEPVLAVRRSTDMEPIAMVRLKFNCD